MLYAGQSEKEFGRRQTDPNAYQEVEAELFLRETRLTLSPIIQSKAYWLCRQSDIPLGQSAYP